MADEFDPYHQWLGISPKYQPPTYYRLLGLELFESNPEVISTAADQRMAHVRSFQTGQRAAICQRILNELSTARLCLLVADKKAEYDAALRRWQEQSRAATAPQPPPMAADDRWAMDLAQNVKAASRFAALQAERVRLLQFRLRPAYIALAQALRALGRVLPDFAQLDARVAAAEQHWQRLDASRRAGPLGKLLRHARLQAAVRQRDSAWAALGEAAFRRDAVRSGPSDLTQPIVELNDRLAKLDAEIAVLSQASHGQVMSPRRLAIVAGGILLFILLATLGAPARQILVLVVVLCAVYYGWHKFRRKN